MCDVSHRPLSSCRSCYGTKSSPRSCRKVVSTMGRAKELWVAAASCIHLSLIVMNEASQCWVVEHYCSLLFALFRMKCATPDARDISYGLFSKYFKQQKCVMNWINWQLKTTSSCFQAGCAGWNLCTLFSSCFPAYCACLKPSGPPALKAFTELSLTMPRVTFGHRTEQRAFHHFGMKLEHLLANLPAQQQIGKEKRPGDSV